MYINIYFYIFYYRNILSYCFSTFSLSANRKVRLIRVFSPAGREIWFERTGVRLIGVNFIQKKITKFRECAKSSNTRGVRLKRCSDKWGSAVLSFVLLLIKSLSRRKSVTSYLKSKLSKSSHRNNFI